MTLLAASVFKFENLCRRDAIVGNLEYPVDPNVCDDIVFREPAILLVADRSNVMHDRHGVSEIKESRV